MNLSFLPPPWIPFGNCPGVIPSPARLSQAPALCGGLCCGLTHLIQAPRRGSSPPFTEEESKAQRDPTIWQPQEPALPLNRQAPHPAAPARVSKRQEEKPQPEKTVGSCRGELWLIKSDAYEPGRFRPPCQTNPGKTPGPPPGFQVPGTTRESVSRLVLTDTWHVSTQLAGSHNCPV